MRQGALPVIIVFPQMSDLRYFKEGEKRKYKPLLSYFDQKGYLYIDLIQALKHMPDAQIDFDGHYTAEMNQIVADSLYDFLEPIVKFHESEEDIDSMDLESWRTSS
jgi:hypothetical protein